jgi:hypothetical protein
MCLSNNPDMTRTFVQKLVANRKGKGGIGDALHGAMEDRRRTAQLAMLRGDTAGARDALGNGPASSLLGG